MRLVHLLTGAALLLPIATALASETVTYSYDAKGRLTGTAHSGSVNNGVAQAYGFDHADNRTGYSVAGAPSGVIADPSFEAPSVGSGYSYNPVVGGASFVANTGVAGNGSAWGFASAPAGSQVGFVRTGSSSAGQIGLAVSNLVVGATYRIELKIAQRPYYGVNTVSVAFQGLSLGAFTPSSTSFQSVTTVPFKATASSGTLTFTGEADASTDRASGIDDVRVPSSP